MFARCLPITSSSKYFGAAGNTKPHSLPISRSKKLKANSPRRGRTNSAIMGHTDFSCSAADFFFLVSAFPGSISAGKGYSDLEVLSTRLQAPALDFGIFVRLPAQNGSPYP